LEWLFPPFNGGHWNPELVNLAGGVDLLGAPGQASSTQSWETIVAAKPDVLFIACCGFRIDRALEDVTKMSATAEWQQLPAVKNGRVYVAYGNAYFSCPGPRLIDGLEIMAHAFHPNIHPPVHGLARLGTAYLGDSPKYTS
jgi:iron complex transport system substrate-binding protein